MILLPFQINAKEYNIFVALEAENLERMKANDPAQINLWKLPSDFQGLRLRDVIITTPSAEDLAKALALARAGNAKEGMALLSRGFKFDPTKGDSDLPYMGSKRTN